MTTLRTPRFLLLTTAALAFGSHASAQSASNYQTGAPTMVAAAPSLPTISAEQIARDVISEFNPRTGARELVAAPFDPFEDDPTLAASLRLRSADGAVAIDGRPLQDGALVEIDFYYNSPSDDPYGGRNYSDAGFINGELAPVVFRDTRILECSTRVENVVYDHASYYGGRSAGIYRPYRHYAGHSSFGFGFGSNYFGPGFGFSNGFSSFGERSSFNGGSSFGGRSTRRNRRILGGGRRGNGTDSRRDGNETNGAGGTVSPPSPSQQDLTDRANEERFSRLRSYWSSGPAAGIRSNGRGSAPTRSGNTPSRADFAPSSTQSPVPQAPSSGSQATETGQAQPARGNTRRSATTRPVPRRSDTTRSDSRRSDSRRSETRRSETRRSEPRRQSNQRSNTRPKKTKSPTPRRRISPNTIKRKLNFFPNEGYGGRSIVSSRSVDCAREDKLRVFIPNDRLDAARFDGLTLIALDAQGGETPIYLPPNYIEGYRLAATGQVRPQGFQSAPQSVTPQRSTPQYASPAPRNRIEAAPCPAGTSKQGDGTCLQTGTSGYPTR